MNPIAAALRLLFLKYLIMKKIIIIGTIITILFSSCDPDGKDIFNFEAVKLAATLNNTNQVISLGDTLKISVQLPDTILNATGTFPVQSVQKAQFYLKFRLVDTINNTAPLIFPPAYWTSYGTISPSNHFSFEFYKTSKPFGVTINFKPQQKGIYYLEVVSQAGQLQINSIYESRLYVNFNVPDNHFNLCLPFLGQTWVNGANQSVAEGFGIYVFRVN